MADTTQVNRNAQSANVYSSAANDGASASGASAASAGASAANAQPASSSSGDAFAHYQQDVAPLSATQVASKIETQTRGGAEDANFHQDLQDYLSTHPGSTDAIAQQLQKDGASPSATQELAQASQGAQDHLANGASQLQAQLSQLSQLASPEQRTQALQQGGIISDSQSLQGDALNDAVGKSMQQAGIQPGGDSFTPEQVASLRAALAHNGVQIPLS